MSEQKDSNLITRVVDAAQRFWPVTLFLIALTLLSRFEDLRLWSDALAFVVLEWRQLMSDFWELIINFFRKIAGFDLIELRPPLPELLTIVSLTICSFRIKDLVDDTTDLLWYPSRLPLWLARSLFVVSMSAAGFAAVSSVVVLFSDTEHEALAMLVISGSILALAGTSVIASFLGARSLAIATFQIYQSLVSVFLMAAVLSYLILIGSYFLELVVLYVGNQFGLFEEFRDLRAPTGD
ncbi:hypothetical protein [Roseobacter sp. S98]|uniref:hypothetical protein n=1 Tax=Roseobacter algicola (ex Choi et al. 2025) (nom. illeg.) TaxID=3092138 RepID=UPI0035C7794A